MIRLNDSYAQQSINSSHLIDSLTEQRDILLKCLTDVLDGLSPKELQNITGMPIEKCEKIIDVCRRLNDGKPI